MSTSEAPSDRSDRLHAEATVINGLAGSMARPKPGVPFDLPAIMRAGGVSAVNLTMSLTEGFGETARGLSHLLAAVEGQSAEGTRIIRSVEDIRAVKAGAGAGIIIGFQNSDCFEGRLEFVDIFHRLGLRICQLTYQRRNLAADGSGEPADGGLSLFGRELVVELNRLGVLIDLSHTSRSGTLETIELSERPVAVTHACLQAFNPVPRNKSDEEIEALAARGGVFGMNAIARLLSAKGGDQGATVGEFVDQIDYLVDLVGIDHVGLGLDINEGLTPELFAERRKGFLTDFPELRMGGDFPFEHYYIFELTTMRNTRLITETLVDRGYADADVLKILGGNFLRLFAEVWQPA